jgi:short-chain fatty acids transporter
MQQHVQQNRTDSWLAASGLRLSDWFERWFPDAFALALAAVAVVFTAAAAVSGAPLRTAQAFGTGFWDLVTFTVQVALLIITGHVVAMFSMLSSLISWTFS